MLSFYKCKFQETNCVNVAVLVAFKMVIVITTIKSCSQKARKAFDVNRFSSMEAHGFLPIDTNLESVLTFHAGIKGMLMATANFENGRVPLRHILQNNWPLKRGRFSNRKSLVSGVFLVCFGFVFLFVLLGRGVTQ